MNWQPMSSPVPSASSSSPLGARLRDAFWLDAALREVSARSAAQQAALRTHYLAGARRADIAEQLTDEQSAVASLILYRDAITHFALAVALARDPAFDPRGAAGSSPFAVLEELAARGLIGKAPPELAEAKAILTTHTDPLAFDALSVDDLLRKRAAVGAASRALRELIEPRSVREIKVSRYTRSAFLGALALVLLCWLGWKISRPTNLALHKPVTISARPPDSTAPVDNSGAVNGEIEGTYGVHTSLGGGWVTVDLQKVYKLTGIKLYNRADGYFNDGLPYILELSQDGKTFTVATQRALPFTSSSPWTQDLPETPARYVRIRSANYVAFAEIEIFGKT